MAITKITTEVIEDGAITSAKLGSGSVSASSLTGITTDNVSEGSTNVYYTDTRARGSVSVTGGNLSYDSGTGVIQLTTDTIRGAISVTDAGGDGSLAYSAGVITYTGPSAAEVRAHFSGSTGVSYNSSTGAISIGQDVGTSATPTFGNITTTGYIAGPATFTIDPAAVGNNTGTVVIAGNLQVDGTTTTINSTTMEVDDLNITLASGAANAAAANGAGITVDGASATITYDGTNDEWDFNKDINVTGTITFDGGTTSADLNFGDNDKAVFGAGSDLQIYHNATDSVIESITGDLYITNKADDSDIIFRTDDGAGGYTTYIQADGSNGEVRLYHYNSEKFNTSSAGVEVTGSITASGVVAANDLLTTSQTSQVWEAPSAASGNTEEHQMRVRWNGNNDIWFLVPFPESASLYSREFFFNYATNEWNLEGAPVLNASGLHGTPDITVGTINSGAITSTGTSSFGVVNSSGNIRAGNGTTTGNVQFTSSSYQISGGSAVGDLRFVAPRFRFYEDAATGTADFSIDNGNVAIGVANAARGPLHVHEEGTTDGQIHLTNANTGSAATDGLTVFADTDLQGIWSRENCDFVIASAGTEAFRLNTSQNAEFAGSISSGNITVSDSSPLITLTDSDVSLSARINGASGNLYLNSHNVNRDVYIGEQGTGNVNMTILGDGNVGIGTVNPQNDLHVDGAGATLRVGPYYPAIDSSTDRDFILLEAGGILSKITTTNETFEIENTAGNIDLDAGGNYVRAINGSFVLDNGTTAQRGGSPYDGTIRFNTDLNRPEIYDGTNWQTLGYETDVTDGLVAKFYGGQNVSGTTITSTNGSYTGTFSATPSIVSDAPTGALYSTSWDNNGSVRCRGNQDISVISSGGTQHTFSIAHWIKVNNSSAPMMVTVIDAGTDPSTLYRWENQGTTSEVEFGIYTQGAPGSFTETTNITITEGVWLHIVFTYDDANMKVYVNNTLQNTTALTSVNPTTSSSQRFQWNGRFGAVSGINNADIHLYNIRYYNRALTGSEVTTLYTNVD